MISLENISIRYNKVLIKKSSMIIHDNSVTLIKGLSGSGKTTLLYRIGLISKEKSYDMFGIILIFIHCHHQK